MTRSSAPGAPRHAAAAVALALLAACVGNPAAPVPARDVRPARISVERAEALVLAELRAVKPRLAPGVSVTLAEIGDDELWRRLDAQLFRVVDGFATDSTWLLRGGEPIALGEQFGGHGVMSSCVADLDGDGRAELVFTYSFGSGIHRSHAAVFPAPTARGWAEGAAFRDADVFVRRIDDRTVELWRGDYGWQYGAWTPERCLGVLELSRTNGVPVPRLR